MTRKKLLALLVPAVIVLVIDQITKWLIRTTPELQNKVLIDGWLQFYFTKNPGMALGIDVLSTPVISVIAILAVTGIMIYIIRHLEQASVGYLVCMGLIVGGAFGNITDRLFMGLIMDYGGVLEGHVVDFIYFSLQIGDWTVFPYIFNVADIAISCSIILLLIFNKRFFITQKAEDGSSEVPDDVTMDEPTKQEGII
ncbi:MAG: signal peptidase II [Gracilimonas sp.]|uniref:signal peptidase II n=1 Tax=Gracilimonas TaxID=649462 RepID=UPI001B0955CB|nr:signal peptidase II [Gracilimonas sp.]MBO6585023.1 signal peptidase II [Gracilimonas sp.]MBO6615706.1 signal peptidase II [Gracilimonas sp.]